MQSILKTFFWKSIAHNDTRLLATYYDSIVGSYLAK